VLPKSSSNVQPVPPVSSLPESSSTYEEIDSSKYDIIIEYDSDVPVVP